MYSFFGNYQNADSFAIFFCINIIHHLNEAISAVSINSNEITGEEISFIKFEERFISKIPHNYKLRTGPATKKRYPTKYM
jgi:hypothetical protein